MQASNGWQSAQRILCIRLDSLGDVLMTTPAMRALRQAAPGRRLTLLTSPAGAKVAPYIPEIDEVVAYEAPWVKATERREDSAPEAEMIARLRGGGYDAAVIFTVFSQNPLPAAMLAYLADIPLRLAHCRENPYQLLTDWVPETDHRGKEATLRHEVRRQLDLVAAVGIQAKDERLSFEVPEGDREKTLAQLEQSNIDFGKPWAVIHPGASAPSRRYPPEGFAAAADMLASQHGVQIVFTGSGKEDSLVRKIQGMMASPSISLVNQLDLGSLGALLSLAHLLISNNSGPVHIAAAVGTPVVDLYALTNPQHTPWMVPNRVLFHDVPCRNCYKSVCPLGHHNCLRLVPPEAVVRATLELMQERVAPVQATGAAR